MNEHANSLWFVDPKAFVTCEKFDQPCIPNKKQKNISSFGCVLRWGSPMISSCTESDIVAIDEDGEDCFVAYEYDYSGYWHSSTTQLGEHKYEFDGLVGKAHIVGDGHKLPRLTIDDMSSYFTDEPTEAMQRATTLAQLKQLSVKQFLRISVHLEGWHTTNVSCTTISPAGETTKEFWVKGVPEKIFGESVGHVVKDILEKGIDGYAAYLDSVREQ